VWQVLDSGAVRGTFCQWRDTAGVVTGSGISFVWHGVCHSPTNPAHSVFPCCRLIQALLFQFTPPPS